MEINVFFYNYYLFNKNVTKRRYNSWLNAVFNLQPFQSMNQKIKYYILGIHLPDYNKKQIDVNKHSIKNYPRRLREK